MYLSGRKSKLVPQNAYKEEEGRSVGLCKNSTSVKRKVLAQEPPRPILGSKEISLHQRDRGHGIRDQYRR